MTIYEIDGNKIKDIDSFVLEMNVSFFSKIEGANWRGNLNAFNDYLSWPTSKYKIIIRNSENCKKALDIQYSSASDQTYWEAIMEIFLDNKQYVEVELV